jgi:hypothetical protein
MRHGDGASLSQLQPTRTSAPAQLALLDAPQTAPSLPALRLWHTSGDGYVSFHRKVNGEFRDVASVLVTELHGHGQPWLPGLLAQLATDSYFSLNAMFRPGVRLLSPRERLVPAVVEGQHVQVLAPHTPIQRFQRGSGGLRFAYRAADAVRWLTAAWVDCDGYKTGLDAPATVAGLMRAWDDGSIPVPSFLVRSGRGAWAFWKLLDERNPLDGERRVGQGGKVRLSPDTPVQASSAAQRLHRAVNHALAARLADLGADTGAGDVARTCRVPGSWHTGAGAHVEVLPVLRDGAMAVYTLSELARWLELGDVLSASTRRVPSSSTLTDAQLAQRLKACHARHRHVHDALLTLSALRGGFGDGHRHHALFHCALAGFRAALDADTVRQRVRGLAASMRPPLSSRDTDATLRDTFRKATKRLSGKPASYATLVTLLAVTPDERQRAGLLAKARRPPSRLPVSARRALVRELVDASVTLGQGVPSQPVLVALLALRGLAASTATVSGDYRALGIVSGQRGGRRPLLDAAAPAPQARPWLR